jgi:glycosyltransferase involved in cell wall biosynthesis
LERVSVVMATYNGARYIEEQINSILAQTHRPSRIVVRDDGSSDETLSIASEILGKSGIAHTITENAYRLGVRGNFSALLEGVDSEYVALCDQDDVWPADKLSLSLAALTENPQANLAFTDAALVSGSGAPLPGRLWEKVGLSQDLVNGWQTRDNGPALLKSNMVTGATILLRGSFLQQALPIPAGVVHDHWLALVANYMGGSVPVARPLLSYRQHENNVLGAGGGKLATLRRRVELVGQQHDRLAFHEALYERVAPLSRYDRALEYLANEIAFLRERCELPARAVARMPKVRHLWRQGLYGQYASGSSSAMVDIARRPT